MARPGHVYVMDAGSGRVKVGVSKHPRMRAVQLGDLTINHVSKWHDQAGAIEKAAHRLLTIAGQHCNNELFRATVDEAVAAVDRAFELAMRGELHTVKPKPNPMVGTAISTELAGRLSKAADRKRDPYAPTVSQIIVRGIELALSELEKRRGK